MGALLTALALIASGCGTSDGGSTTNPPTAVLPQPANTERPAPTPQPEASNSSAKPSDGRKPGLGHGGDASQAEKERAAAAAEDAYSTYVQAINARDGEALCGLLPPDAVQVLKPPVERGSCSGGLSASIGYRDPRGYPVWKRTTLTGFEGSSVTRDLASARLTAGIVTDFADRSEPSVESDIAYMELIDGRWRLAKPSSAIYRAIGRPEPPPDVISPPAD
jgi:hypothetical protein